MTTAVKTKTYRFISRGTNLRLVRIPKLRLNDQFGRQYTAQEGVAYEFAPDGFLDIAEGQDVFPTGERLEDEDALTWLRRHPNLNIYFHEEGREPGRMFPTEEEVNAAIVAGVADLDPAPLEQMRAEEVATHRRSHVLSMLDTALETIAEREQRVKAAAAAAAAEQAAAAAKTPPHTPPSGPPTHEHTLPASQAGSSVPPRSAGGSPA